MAPFVPDTHAHAVVLFDGVCNLCNAAVTFIIDRDPEAVLRFAPLQSDVGQRLVRTCRVEDVDSIVLVERDRCYVRFDAALRVARRLSGIWPLLGVLRAVPAPIRDAGYRFIARHRHRWFGTRAACRVPTPALRRRFLDYSLPPS